MVPETRLPMPKRALGWCGTHLTCRRSPRTMCFEIFSTSWREQALRRVPSRAPTADLKLGGETSHVESAVYERDPDQRFVLLWIGAPSWDPDRQVRLAVPDQTVTVEMEGGKFVPQTLWTFDADGALKDRAMARAAPGVGVTDQVSIVEFRRR